MITIWEGNQQKEAGETREGKREINMMKAYHIHPLTNIQKKKNGVKKKKHSRAK
jgi:hypothetical protein